MVHHEQSKLRSLIKPIAKLLAGILLIGVAALFGTDDSHADIKAINVAYAPMHTVVKNKPTLPRQRPDPALAYGLQPVDIPLPQSKPALHDILPISTVTLAETIKAQTGRNSTGESIFLLRSGEGVGAILMRAGYSAADIAAAIGAASKKASLRRLQIGMRFTIAEHGFRFSVKPGMDIYILRDPESGWIAINAIRPVETYISFIQGTINDSIYRAALEAGINEAVFNEYVRVLGFSVDFQREIRNGDKFEMMYAIDRDLISGNIVGSNLKYVGLSLSGDQLSFFRYESADGAVGWAAGIERLSMLAGDAVIAAPKVTLLSTDPETDLAAFRLAEKLRDAGIDIEFPTVGAIGKKLKKAARSNIRLAIIIGSNELAKNTVQLRDLTTGIQTEILTVDLADEVAAALPAP